MADTKTPNILVVMAHDIGIWNRCAYHRGMMRGRTPNIDRPSGVGARRRSEKARRAVRQIRVTVL